MFFNQDDSTTPWLHFSKGIDKGQEAFLGMVETLVKKAERPVNATVYCAGRNRRSEGP
jgi:hypothetical protein